MRFEVYEDSAGEWRWRLLARNGQVIATAGEGYARKADCLHGVTLVAGQAASASLHEV